jgi:hypothetical protein
VDSESGLGRGQRSSATNIRRGVEVEMAMMMAQLACQEVDLSRDCRALQCNTLHNSTMLIEQTY